jgi:hypothetical protein
MSNQPTAAQRRKWGKLAGIGCICCRKDGNEGTPAEIHHIKDHGNHNHDRVLPLCLKHHNERNNLVPCIHHNRIEFIDRYGTPDELLAECMELI